jgi:hypothetical protein
MVLGAEVGISKTKKAKKSHFPALFHGELNLFAASICHLQL